MSEDFFYKGHEYSFVCKRTHVTRDGRNIELNVYRTHCAACGEEFETMAPPPSAGRYMTRRCSEHRRPGVRV